MNVYWSIDNKRVKGSLRAEKIEPVYKNLFKNRNASELQYTRCPAFKDYFNNVYALKALYTYKLVNNGEQILSPLYDQDFFDSNIRIFSVEEQLISLHPHTIFVTDSPSLEMSVEHPHFEDNKFTKTCYAIPGIVDIGKYYRFLDFAFHIKKEHNTFEIDEGDTQLYLRFHTKETIKFKQYYMTDRLREYAFMVEHIKEHIVSKALRPLSYFYAIFKKSNLKKRILEEIKRNLV
jgi:hypothetical protein